MYAIKVENLGKSYGTNNVLNGISFSVSHGEIFALLGTNGAGKTTTLECIEGLLKYENGSIQITGTYGVQSQSSSIPRSMKANEALSLFAKWQHTEINPEYLERLGIQPFMKKQYCQLSTGQKRRLHLAIALLGNPDIVFLDEPTAGLDVEGRVSIHSEIKNLKAQGKTIILASHDMAEVEELCNKIAILKEGKIAFLGTSEELTETSHSLFVLKVRFSEKPLNSAIFSGKTQDDKGYYVFETKKLEDTLADVIECCRAQDITMTDVKVERAGIEQRFLEITKEAK